MQASPPHSCSDPMTGTLGLHEAREELLAGRPYSLEPRRSIDESWRRSLAAGVSPEVRAAPLVYDRDRLDDARAAHPLDPHLPMLREALRGVADAEHVMVVTDEAGHLLWCDVPPGLGRAADGIGLLEGFCWSEGSVGTNGIGTTLAREAPTYVYSAEHLAMMLHQWSCVAAPISDPDSGRLIGCVDISATVDRLHPATVALAATAARLAEAQLALDMRARDDRLRGRHEDALTALRGRPGALLSATGRVVAGRPGGFWAGRLTVPEEGGALVLPGGGVAVAEALGDAFLVRVVDLAMPDQRRPQLQLSMLATEQPAARLDGRDLPLSGRRAEILALLALHPQGLNADQCSYHLYGDEGNPVSLRSEIHRLRAQLGAVVAAKPYRLDCDVDADFLKVRDLLDAGDAAAAARLYTGPLLPRSESPTLRELREELTARMRGLLLEHGDADALWRFAATDCGRDDMEVLDRLSLVLPRGDTRHAAVGLRTRRLGCP